MIFNSVLAGNICYLDALVGQLLLQYVGGCKGGPKGKHRNGEKVGKITNKKVSFNSQKLKSKNHIIPKIKEAQNAKNTKVATRRSIKTKYNQKSSNNTKLETYHKKKQRDTGAGTGLGGTQVIDTGGLHRTN